MSAPDSAHGRAGPDRHTQGRPPGYPAGPLRGVLFDMDGVVTDTADAHAAAWKRLFDEYLEARPERAGEDHDPFDSESDYRAHVDGKPRYDGVAGFLEARGIELPYGDPSDPPDRETICGLGNRKDGYFTQWLQDKEVRRYPTTVALIGDLRAAGIRVAVFSASRNCEVVLRAAGVHDLFDARVDGNDLAGLGLAGKPDPAILHEATRRLGVSADATAVVEDSVAGVEAGARGGYRPVVGVDRGDYGRALFEAGADIVVGDPGELRLDPDRVLVVRRLHTLPSARRHLAEIRERIGARSPMLFLDYDGTLTPIVNDPAAADLPHAMRSALARLAERVPVAIISGRGLNDLQRRVGLGTVIYAGSHGFELRGPDFEYTAERAEAFLPGLDAAEAELRRRLADIEGILIERKRFAIAIHYRRVAATAVDAVEAEVDAAVSAQCGLRKRHGKKVFQVQPRLDWNKGRAVAWVLERLESENGAYMPVYIGDDLTDEDAFRALAGRGITIAVRDGERATAADYALDDTSDVEGFLTELCAHVDGGE